MSFNGCMVKLEILLALSGSLSNNQAAGGRGYMYTSTEKDAHRYFYCIFIQETHQTVWVYACALISPCASVCVSLRPLCLQSINSNIRRATSYVPFHKEPQFFFSFFFIVLVNF